MKKLLASFATALGLAALMNRVGASRVQTDAPRHRRSRWGSKCAAPLTTCRRCRKRVSARAGRTHICVTRYIPAPAPGRRWQGGKLISRHVRGAGAA